ncbi:hypothetical protein GCM10011507_03850 [Edaphobacter acidisoli]|uniref:TolC family protein n=1 Tax=Edaphobacter acidisoli TaxID=2040573 RepID=A0A916RH29_9BACT|nr:TolC family protein [Edaphobacter acidisoli]GGA55794.1 hypothetical protein GCM10011507_03850 [Edaphobacter acidisoli]
MRGFQFAVALSLMMAIPLGAQMGNPPAPSAPPQTLTISQAEQIAIRNNPRMAVSRLLALAQGQVKREVQSAELPTVGVDLTAVDSHNGSRITAGGLNNPTVYQRAAAGATLQQLITDFGRTRNLVASSQLQTQAAQSAQMATSQDITFAVDEAFFHALSTQAVLRVAQETVDARQTTADQVSALTGAKLKSTLDQSFANVDLAQAKLLLVDAQNDNEDAMVVLNALLGNERAVTYSLVDETPNAPRPAPDDAEPLVTLAFKQRPDLLSLNEQYAAAQKYSKAEHDLWMPTVSALGVSGDAPVRADQITTPWYGAVGVNVNIPVFNGFLYSARAKEADLRASAADQQVQSLRQTIARDVRTTVLEAQSNFHRIAVTQQLVNEANSAFDLAQTRYKIGLSSIVELTQAQLVQTQAQIAYVNARYAYQGSLAALRFQTGQ